MAEPEKQAPLIQEVLDGLLQIEQKVAGQMDVLLANLVMVGEIPSPTFEEARRIEFLQDRFIECGLQNCSSDEAGNAVAILPGESGDKNILLVAHVDTVHHANEDHTITLKQDKAIGPSIADNSLGVAALASIPTILENLGMQLNANLVLLGEAQSLGRGNLEGLRFFLENNTMPFQAGICIEGVQLGRLSYASVGMLRGEITCSVPEEYPWTGFEAAGAIVTLNEVIDQMLVIPIPKRPRTSIILGAIQGGTSHHTLPSHAQLKFEVRSESSEMLQSLHNQLKQIVSEVSATSEAEVSLDIFARRQAGGIPFSHPLVQNLSQILKTLGIESKIGVSISELSAFIDREIPAITLGITTGAGLGKTNENVNIKPISKGMAQLVGTLIAIDKGLCDDN